MRIILSPHVCRLIHLTLPILSGLDNGINNLIPASMTSTCCRKIPAGDILLFGSSSEIRSAPKTTNTNAILNNLDSKSEKQNF